MTAVEIPRTDDERRALVQAASARYYRRKVAYSWIFLGLMALMLLLAFIPLGSIVWNVVDRGVKIVDWTFLTTPQKNVQFTNLSDYGGISNAIVGTTVIFLGAILIAIPVSMALAIALYESKSRVVHALRIYLEVMIGLPSILFGIFIYFKFVLNSGGVLAGYKGSLALALMMLPLMSISGERALRDTPNTYVEAALALGAKRSRIMRRVVFPYALPRIWTGIMLSMSRAIGETAPILFVIGTSYVVNWSPKAPQTAFSTMIWNNLQSESVPVQESCWGIALVLITVVFIFNLASRIFIARSSKGRS
jgi:phosphate transport system permease protein